MNSTTWRLTYLGVFLLIWLIPVLWTGCTLRGISVFPPWWTIEYQVSGLFLKEHKASYDYHLEWKSAGSDMWTEVDERKLYPYAVLADRSRFDQLMTRAAGSQLRSQIYFKITTHALNHGKKVGLLPKNTSELRLVRTMWMVGTPEMAEPKSGWKRASSMKVPADRRKVLAHYLVQEEGIKPLDENPRQKLPESLPKPFAHPLPVVVHPPTNQAPPPTRTLVPGVQVPAPAPNVPSRQ